MFRSIIRKIVPVRTRYFLSNLTHRIKLLSMLFPKTILRVKEYSQYLLHSIKQGLYHGTKKLWFEIQANRKLLAPKPSELNIKQQIQRQLLIIILKVAEQRYARFFQRFEQALDPPTLPPPQQGKGLMLMIGSLGPGGAERQAMYTLQGLAKKEMKPLSLTAFYLETEAQRFYLPHIEAAGIPVRALTVNSLYVLSHRAQQAIIAVKELPILLQDVTDYIYELDSQSPDILHLWLDEINIKAGIAAVALGIPKIILSTRSLPPIHYSFHQFYMYEAYQWLLKQPNVLIINNSMAGARGYEQWLKIPKKSISVIHNGFDLDNTFLDKEIIKKSAYRNNKGIQPDILLVGTVMRLSEEKRPLLFADIASEVRRLMPEVQFLIVGDGPQRAELEARAACPDLAGAFHIVGYEKEPFPAIAAMDIFVLTSRGEGLPNVLLEAQALCVPVVTTDVGGASEAVEHGETGWVLESDHPTYAAEVIVKLLQDQKWRQEASTKGREFVKNRFGMVRMIEETSLLYGVDQTNKTVAQ